MNLFFRDGLSNRDFSWENLVDDLNASQYFNPYLQSIDFYEVFKGIILSKLLGKEITLLDGDFSPTELFALTGVENFTLFQQEIPENEKIRILSKKHLLFLLNDESDNWKLSLFTSGTTGLPKKVTHSFASLTRFVNVSEKHQNDLWGYAYNPTHMAGIQVFFQALLNGNAMFRLFGLPPELCYKEISQYQITHISATPTFYRLLLADGIVFTSVNRLTSGGEKFNENMQTRLIKMFPNAKINNVYASTEAGTLLASEGDLFSIKAGMEHLLKIENNELLIHTTLMGDSDQFSGDWYFSGDMVEIVQKDPLCFRFLSRKNEMINVGGYKVNPGEIEDAIIELDGILNVRVFSKSNSVLGNIIFAEVVKSKPEITEAEIRKGLQDKLQEFKIPRMIKFVEVISTTRTGKVKRN